MKASLSAAEVPGTNRTSARTSSKSTFRFISVFTQPVTGTSPTTTNMPPAAARTAPRYLSANRTSGRNR